jgi:uncharacterized membrane protein
VIAATYGLSVVNRIGALRRPHDVAMTHVIVAAVPGIVVGLVISLLGPVAVAPLIGWDVAAATFLASTWVTLRGLDGTATKQHAVRDDPSRGAVDLTVLIASAASLVAVIFLIGRASHAQGSAQVLQAALAVGSVVMSWLVVHTTYMLRYAVIYHTNAGGVDFNQDGPPRYTDFAYLAFTIGMTFQVSDTSITSSEIRADALRHALLSYVYGTFIIAATINLIAGLNR